MINIKIDLLKDIINLLFFTSNCFLPVHPNVVVENNLRKIYYIIYLYFFRMSVLIILFA